MDPALQTTNKPRTRQRKHKTPPSLDVPDINENAAERKRILNVLAQRRYRKREAHAHQAQISDQAGLAVATTRAKALEVMRRNEPETTVNWDPAAFSTPDDNATLGNFSDLAGSATECGAVRPSFREDMPSPSLSSIQSIDTIDPMALFGSLIGSPSSTSKSDVSFPDTYLLPVIELTLLRAFMRIASRLGCTSSVWDIHATSPFTDPSSPTQHLPQTWQPTTAQLLVPHHPLLDFLPWPSVREKIISVFTLPEEMRPAAAKSPTALVQFAYDLEDGAEGIRIWGEDPYDPLSWEVGQLLFERWWFIFDGAVIEQSNSWRVMRGAARLRITAAEDTR
ncbi:hypothetical protein M406DRAFT_251725 [Cryphonectria parasitica EP155]|uniref:BZIP domain-containing protein n=1 Tax=Cryphonectria parasitica (strain ATCC 38755 / EP155) TaxID=660469 RepID=A0A9P5CRS8_CRYP1|nr:uncharacterized protein M406DRAFT_251725 [Cryphonectria parasitica EP155]KAF3767420.1 hypothetical protein M406DRAFT_251725 [Cryphonectria parasitica EP155]